MARARLRTLSLITGSALLTGGLATTAASSAAAATPSGPTVIASGLNNPRHLTFAGNHLLVAESGTGGDGPCIVSSEGGQVCYGATGSVTELVRRRGAWHQKRVVTGLPSLAAPADDPANGVTKGGSATGPSDVEGLGGHYLVSVGLGAPPSARGKDQATTSPTSTAKATLPKGFGTVLVATGWSKRHHLGNRFHVLADIARHEDRTNPVDTPDSNPASLLRVDRHVLVADAGGNTVVSAGLLSGHVSTVASFPDQMVQVPGAPDGTLMPMQAVPTSVTKYRGDLYVSQLTGFPFPQGGSTIWKIDWRGHKQAYATGLTNVTDLAFAGDGSLYAVEISTAGLASGGPPIGALVRIPRGGGAAEVVAGGLFAPYGVALHGGAAYVTTGSVLPGGGEVVRIPLS
jgi:hypothetical protein